MPNVRYTQPTLVTERPQYEGDEWSAVEVEKLDEKVERAAEAAQAYMRAGSDRHIAIGYAADDHGVDRQTITNYLYGD